MGVPVSGGIAAAVGKVAASLAALLVACLLLLIAPAAMAHPGHDGVSHEGPTSSGEPEVAAPVAAVVQALAVEPPAEPPPALVEGARPDRWAVFFHAAGTESVAVFGSWSDRCPDCPNCPVHCHHGGFLPTGTIGVPEAGWSLRLPLPAADTAQGCTPAPDHRPPLGIA